jgi:hypothetical protein
VQLIKVIAVTGAVGALAVTAACGAAAPEPAPVVAPGPAETIALGEGSDRTASQSVNDWATYADHVLVVTVVAENRQAPVKRDVDRGEGLVARTVKLRVDKVLWSAPDAPRAAPAGTLKLAAAGWIFNENDGADERKMALKGSARLDVGHTYIKALEWVDDPCFPDPKKGSWEGLGSGDTVPFDGGVLGAGEFEGRARTLGQLKGAWKADPADARSLRGQLAGEPVAKLVSGLSSAVPAVESYPPAECDLSDR